MKWSKRLGFSLKLFCFFSEHSIWKKFTNCPKYDRCVCFYKIFFSDEQVTKECHLILWQTKRTWLLTIHTYLYIVVTIKVCLPFVFSDMTSLIFLTLVSFLAAYCLTKIFQKIQQHWKFHFREIIPLKEKHPTDVMATLHGTDKDSIKTLIRNENKSNRVLSQTLRLINMDGTGSEDLASRRQAEIYI